MNNKRETGYYWIKYMVKSNYTIAYWNSEHAYWFWNGRYFDTDSDFTKIHEERIKEPND